MANRRNYKTGTNKGLAIFCVILAFVIVAACTLGGLQLWGKGKAKPSEWFRSDPVVVEEENVKYETTLPANGGMTLPEKVEDGEEDDAGVKSNGIALMSVKIPVAQYAAYGISPTTETAKTVTATVSPDNEASNTKIKWELTWKNPASAWATGKEVSDYVTLSSDKDDLMGSKTCTVSCSQAFGEQLQLKAICVEDEEKFATCNVDYMRQVKSASVAIGDISVNLGGNTDITIAVRRDHDGKGGTVTVTPTYGDVYTIESEFTAAASLTHERSGQEGGKWLAYSYTLGGPYGNSELNYNDDNDLLENGGDSIYFDRRVFTQYNFYAGGTSWEGSELKPKDDQLFSSIEQVKGLVTRFNQESGGLKNKVIWTMKVRLTSGSYEYTYESDLVWAAIDEAVTITGVQIGGGGVLFP